MGNIPQRNNKTSALSERREDERSATDAPSAIEAESGSAPSADSMSCPDTTGSDFPPPTALSAQIDACETSELPLSPSRDSNKNVIAEGSSPKQTAEATAHSAAGVENDLDAKRAAIRVKLAQAQADLATVPGEKEGKKALEQAMFGERQAEMMMQEQHHQGPKVKESKLQADFGLKAFIKP